MGNLLLAVSRILAQAAHQREQALHSNNSYHSMQSATTS